MTKKCCCCTAISISTTLVVVVIYIETVMCVTCKLYARMLTWMQMTWMHQDENDRNAGAADAIIIFFLYPCWSLNVNRCAAAADAAIKKWNLIDRPVYEQQQQQGLKRRWRL